MKVQFLADTLFSLRDVVYIARLVSSHDNFELCAYNPPSDALVPGTWSSLGIAISEFDRVNQRMHNKVMVVDGEWDIAGGRNYQDHYFDEDYRLNYRDRDVTVQGPVVHDMEASFDSYWNHLASIPVTKFKDVSAALSNLPPAERGWPFTRDMLGITEIGIRVDKRLASGGVALDWHDVTRIASGPTRRASHPSTTTPRAWRCGSSARWAAPRRRC